MDDIQPGKVEIAPIEQVVGARLDREMIERIDLVHLAVAYIDKWT